MKPNNLLFYFLATFNALKYDVFSVFLFAIMLFTSCTSLEAPINRRVISDGEYKEELAITTKTPKALSKRSYHWFKSQDIYASQNDYAGLLLDGVYTKYYYTNELAEKGSFKKGLKSGKWTSWHKNGTVSEVSKWKKGRRNNSYVSRDSLGNTNVYGDYKNGLKTGYWIYPTKGDTLYFYKGTSIEIDSTFKESSLFQRTFSFLKKNKKGDTTKKERKKGRDTTKTGFFKRLFKKKNADKKQAVEKEKKKLSQGERAKLVKAKEGKKITNLQEDEIPKKGKKYTKDESISTKKKRKVAETVKNNTNEKSEKLGFFKRLFRKKEVEFNQNIIND